MQKRILGDDFRMIIQLRHGLDRARWSPRGRRIAWLLLCLGLWTVFPAAIGAAAAPQTGTASGNQVDALGWMNVRDSGGVPVLDYTFAAPHGSLFDPLQTVVVAILGLEFVGYKVIVTTAVWMIGYALSFQWLRPISGVVTGVADQFASQIATPLMLTVAGSIGAFIVAWFVVRGYHAKAVMQVVTMVGVAIIGPFFLSQPLADVLSSDGLLAQGRDLGLSVAAGLNGRSSPAPAGMVPGLEAGLADNFARQPTQVWNFGHVIDLTPSCRTIWSTTTGTGSDAQVLAGLRNCGDSAAYARASSPDMGQIGSGLVLLISATVLLIFGVYLSIKIIWSAYDAIYHGFLSIFGFAAGGFIYGPTQTFLIRNLVDSFIAAARMTAFTIFLGVYVLFLGNLFKQAPAQYVLVLGAIVEVIAVFQLKRLSGALDRSSHWIANRFALATQNGLSKSAGGGGTALGMGTNSSVGAGQRLLTTMAAVSAVNSSPITAWLAAGTLNPLNPLAFGRKTVDKANIKSAPMNLESQEWNKATRKNARLKALARAEKEGGLHTELGLAAAVDGLGDSAVTGPAAAAVLLALGVPHAQIHNAQRATAVQTASRSNDSGGFAPLQKAVAAALAVENHVGDKAHRNFAAQAVIAAQNFRRHAAGPAKNAVLDNAFIAKVEAHADSDIALRKHVTAKDWSNADRDTRWYLGKKFAEDHLARAQAYYRNPTDKNREGLTESARRLTNLHHVKPEQGVDPWPRW
ncbi:hypothetical protein ACQP1G_20095 [Nocardia sp. CA-107356]|uniref:hypothetical protein n=1 Tax=Nocardia sp. CA-107356 TaxID=3239972 RepID=UPI003D937703